MKPFLFELAEEIYSQKSELSKVTLVFPNRRAALYFRKHLSSLIAKPVFAPALLTFEDFVSSLSPLRVPEKLELVSVLHRVYNEVLGEEEHYSPEGFDQFYSWGIMLLKDFDELDKYMVKANLLFGDLSHVKELDESFDFLSDEQKEYLKNFWAGFEESITGNKKKFLSVWKKLFGIYDRYRSELLSLGIAYEGLVHRQVAEQLTGGKLKLDFTAEKPLWFVGFNAFTKAEEEIIGHAVQNNHAHLAWDLDQYYLNDNNQEAGKFFREHKLHPVFRSTFPNAVPDHFRKPKHVDAYAAAQPIAQAKWLAEILNARLQEGMVPEETIIVLPDEKMLMPVLHSISGFAEKINVTMGFSLTETPIYNLVELLIDLQISYRHGGFNHRQAIAVLEHPYIAAANMALAQSKRKEIIQHNWVSVDKDFLGKEESLHAHIFQPAENISRYVLDITNQVGEITSLSDFDKEFILVGKKCLTRLSEVLTKTENAAAPKQDRIVALKSFLRLFRQVARTEKMPFTGEPLKGLQIMGVLETRNIDFKNVFILSLNEGVFPTTPAGGSYVPFSLRKAYNLPTQEHQGAIYSYLFYRLLQRAENIHLFYNSETDVLGQGEMSRYLQQLFFESNLPIQKHILHNSARSRQIEKIKIPKDANVLRALAKLNEDSVRFRGISPSAINTYMSCKLKFYFRHLAKIREPRQVEEEIDARVLGTILHLVMELFYKKLMAQKGHSSIVPSDFDQLEQKVNALIDEAFIDYYKLEKNKKVEYEGQRVVVREVVKDFVTRILEADKKYAPFEMVAVEESNSLYNVKISHAPGYVVLGGKIDRIDRKEGRVRVIDYKTGNDKMNFRSVESLFSREKDRNKAAFQTILYALLFLKNSSVTNGVMPSLISRNNVYDGKNKFGLFLEKEEVTDVSVILAEFEERLKLLLEEIFNPEEVFDQTDDLESCRICPYKEICYR